MPEPFPIMVGYLLWFVLVISLGLIMIANTLLAW
jgi:hypothetical protein